MIFAKKCLFFAIKADYYTFFYYEVNMVRMWTFFDKRFLKVKMKARFHKVSDTNGFPMTNNYNNVCNSQKINVVIIMKYILCDSSCIKT